MRGSYQYHAIDIKHKGTLPKINPDMLAWLHHPYRWKELSSNFAERRAYPVCQYKALNGRSHGIKMANANL